MDENMKNTLDLAENLLKDGFICKITQGIFHFSEFGPIKIGDEILISKPIDLQRLENLGYEKIKNCHPVYGGNFIMWIKKSENK